MIADCGFHEFKRQLEYKAKKFGCEIIIADEVLHEKNWQPYYNEYPTTKTDQQNKGCQFFRGQMRDRWFPSSKTCSNCAHIQDMPLKERTYNCKGCGCSIDRDLNAAINLSHCVGRVPRLEACGVSRLAKACCKSVRSANKLTEG